MMANGQRKKLYEDFTNITGCKSNRRITQYLEACGFDLATAVDLFFAQDGGSDNAGSDDIAMISDEEEVQCIQSTSKNTRRTRAARGAASSSSAASSSRAPPPSSSNGYHDQEEVRAPIPSTRGQLVQHSFAQQYGTREATRRDGIFNRDFRTEAEEQERLLRERINACEPEVRQAERNNGNHHYSMLQSLFKPPIDIMCRKPFEGARDEAIEHGKWLLVNVQDPTEFASQTLNRDIWSNSGVKELVRTNFVFWQVMHDEVDGRRLCNYYDLRAFPAIFIADPRTGENVFTIALKKQDPVTICDSFTSFLEKFPDFAAHDRFMVGGSMEREQDAFGPCAVPNAAAEPECSRSAMVSQEESERAMRKRRGDDDIESNGKRTKYANIDDALNETTRMLSVSDPEEWRQMIAPGGQMCRIRLKLPDGRVETLEITDNSKLKALFCFIAGANLHPRDHLFVLAFPRRVYSIDDRESTLKSLGFSRNEMVHVELK